MYDVGISGEGETITVRRDFGNRDAGLILQLGELRIGERADENIMDQIAHRLAAAAMRERHRVAADLPGLAANPLDTLKERMLLAAGDVGSVRSRHRLRALQPRATGRR